jgi:diguanylate cyclase (GGDEF)-like protein
MVDIDFFKRINDTHGHDAGDAVIRAVAQRLRARFRKTDIVARIGGEEFCVVAVNLDRSAAPGLFEALRRDIEAAPVVLGDKSIPATVSMGVCLESRHGLQDCVNLADELLYRAKHGGRNRVELSA